MRGFGMSALGGRLCDPEAVTEHPIPWENLKPYEQQQGGYWLYGPDCDVYGNGKQWVSVPHPRPDDEVTPSGQLSAGGTGSTT